MKLNVSRVLKREAENKAKAKPLPRVRVGKSVGDSPQIEPAPVEPTEPEINGDVSPTGAPQGGNTEQQILLDKLDAELAQMKRDRGKLATRTAWLVDELYQKLHAQSPAMAEEFMKGNLPMPELANHYNEIEAHTDRGAVIHEQREHVKRYGLLPSVEPVGLKIQVDSLDVSGLKYQIRRLDDFIYKKTKNLEKVNKGIRITKNSGRPAQWREELALAEAQREGLKQQLKRKQYESRAERIGA